MSFWKNNSTDPSRKFRFQIIGGDQWYWVKSVDKPSYEVNTNEYLLTNHKFKYPGVLTWNDITITMVDPGAIVSKIDNYLIKSGYSTPKKDTDSGIEKNGYDGEGGVLQIQQLGSTGEPIEDWHLYGAFIKSANYGSLEYSSDELVEVQMVISYDYATISAESE
jgi:hypothetical protein